MPKFEWMEQHSVHVPEIDDEHQTIFDLCRNLHRAVAGRSSVAQVHSLVGELAVHTLEHFWHEEQEMRATGYAFYAWHKQQHHTARSRMNILEGRIRGGDRAAARELLVFMQRWLNDHIRLTDRMLGAHLRNHRRELTARAS